MNVLESPPPARRARAASAEPFRRRSFSVRGVYRTLLEARPPELLAPLAFPEASIDLADVFRGLTAS